MNNFDFLFYSNPQPMWIYDTDTLKILAVNDAAIALYGYKKDEFLSKTIIDLRPPEDVKDLEKVLQEIHERKNVHPNEFRHLTKGNTIIHVEIISYPLTFNGVNARLVYAKNIDADIKNKLKIAEQNLEQILDNTPIGFYRLDPDFKITYWNKAAETITSYPASHVLGNNLWDIFPESVKSGSYTHLQKAMKERVTVQYTTYYWPMQKWFSLKAYPVEDDLVVHVMDVTKEKLAEEKLLRRIEQLKEISYLNSHYIRKPIATLLGLCTLIKDGLANPSEYKEINEYIYKCGLDLDEAVNRLNKKVNDEDSLMALSHEMKDFGFNALLKEIKVESQAKNPQHKIILNKTGKFRFYGNKARIKIAIENLVDNAIKFSPNANKIILATKLVDNNLILSIQDFGKGMNARTLNKIYLNLAKKEPTRGPGSGLLKTSEIVKKYNGSIWVESEEGKGSVFSIRFPISNFSTYKITGKPTDLVDEDLGLGIEYNDDTHILYVDWKGFHNLQSIKVGGSQILDALKEHSCHAILNDNSNLLGTWGDAFEWVGKEWFPMAEKAGLKYFAWIYSPNTFTRLFADLAIERVECGVTIKTFNNKDEGVEWLKEVAQ